MSAKKKPIVGITMGDPAGIGPEIILKALKQARIHSACNPLVFGTTRFLAKLERYESAEITFRKIKTPAEASYGKGRINVVECPTSGRITPGRKTAGSGKASLDYLNKAIDLATGGEVDAIVTAPLSKAAVRLGGETSFVGHTEHLAERTKTRTCAMMFYGRRLKVVLVTTHVPLKEVTKAITTEKIVQVTSLANEALKKLGFQLPRIGMAALNPHAGEEGAFGDEDKKIVAPAVRHARKQLLNVQGPIPADTLFRAAYNGEFDLVVAMYHDQALAPFKMIAFDTGVNITLGLPFVRTSVDHGTAFDIAGKGMASEKSLAEAIKLAAKMVK
jgi:4-hydroxythreonine-4-phosphate dehydrogenase